VQTVIHSTLENKTSQMQKDVLKDSTKNLQNKTQNLKQLKKLLMNKKLKIKLMQNQKKTQKLNNFTKNAPIGRFYFGRLTIRGI
jgi:exonuclease VII large subunit